MTHPNTSQDPVCVESLEEAFVVLLSFSIQRKWEDVSDEALL